MIHIYTGNGKGKTTAAIGQAVRAIGVRKKVLMIQFIKSPKWLSGEEKALKKFGRFFKLKKGGMGFLRSSNVRAKDIPKEVKIPDISLSEHQKVAQKTFEFAKREILSGKWDLVILDEINVALHFKLVNLKDFLEFLKSISRPQKQLQQLKHLERLELILTGRNAPKSLIKIADLATEMKELKHYYKKGIQARRGVEY